MRGGRQGPTMQDPAHERANHLTHELGRTFFVETTESPDACHPSHRPHFPLDPGRQTAGAPDRRQLGL